MLPRKVDALLIYDYFVTSIGEVYLHQDPPKKMPQYVDQHGNFYVKLNRQKFYVHRLVAEIFLRPPDDPSLKYVLHLDGDKSNNRVDNLAWSRMRVTNPVRGSDHHNSKLSFEIAEQIRAQYEIDSVSYSDLAREYGVGYTTIRNIVKGITWRRPQEE